MAEPNVHSDGESAPNPASVVRPRTSAFFFGSTARPLFGLYGPPQSATDQDHGVLLCSPVGHEYMRGHWGMRLLGDQLIQSGFHVMRFDYSCMGDSWGEFDGASVEQWVADIQVAAEELRDNAGVRQISIVGLRLGATLAYAAAKEVSLHHLVLLDPVPQGRAYLDRLRGMQTRLRQTWPHAPACMGGAEHEDLLGYRYAAGLVEQIGKLDLGAAPIPQANRVSWVLSAEDLHCKQLHTQLDEKRIKGEFRVISETGSWEAVEDDLYAEPMLLPTMRRMVPEILGE